MLNGPLNRKAGSGRHSTRPRLSGLAHARGAPAQEGLATGLGRACARGIVTQAFSPRPRPLCVNHGTQDGGAQGRLTRA